MGYTIREMHADEYRLLEDFLYEAIFIPEGAEPPARDIIKLPDLQVYIKDFGTLPCDTGYAAFVDGRAVGAAWARIMHDYGHIDDETPSLAVALYKEYRGQGIGTGLMSALLSGLRDKGCRRTSLSVQKANYAVKMYRKLGFVTVDENDEEYIMLKDL